METTTTQRTTALGTPISPRWDAAWAAEVEHVESQLNRRICGAHTPAWTPCKLGPNHDNGRCRFHGGHPKIGAPKGNLNAVTHGLYMRRLQQCGQQCPLWQLCPLAGADVLALDPKERPYCAYESEEYAQTLKTLTSSLAKEEVSKKKADEETFIASVSATADPDARSEGSPDLSFRRKPESPCATTTPDEPNDSSTTDLSQKVARSSSGATAPVDDTRPNATLHTSTPTDDPHPVSLGPTLSFPKERVGVFHNIALYQTMFSRATAAVRVIGLTDEYLSEGEHHRAHSTRVGAILNAQLRIARELRQWIRLAANDAVQGLFGLRPDDPDPNPEDDAPRGLPDIMKDVLARTEGVLEQSLRPRTDDEYNSPGAPIHPSRVGIDGPFGRTGPAPA